MKAFCYSFVTRTAAFALAVIFAVVAGLSGMMLLASYASSMDPDQPHTLYETIYSDTLSEAMNGLISDYQTHLDLKGDAPFEPDATWKNEYPDVLFLAVDGAGETLFGSAVSAEDARYMENFTFTVYVDKGDRQVTQEICSDEDASKRALDAWSTREDVEIISSEEEVQEDGSVAVSVVWRPAKKVLVFLTMGLRQTLTDRRLLSSLETADFLCAAARVSRWLLPVGLVVALAMTALLCCAAGHRRGTDERSLTWIDHVPLDLTVGIAAFFSFLFGWLLFEALPYAERFRYGSVSWMACAGALTVIAIMALWVIVTFAARVTVGGWWRNNVVVYLGRAIVRLVRWIFRGLREGARAMPGFLFLWIGFGALCVLEVIFMSTHRFVAFWLLEKVVLTGLLILLTIWLQRLRRAAGDLAEGRLDTKVDLAGMTPRLREHGENLNSLGDVLNQAVEERTRSERMKAELITNVSHDIKTPLTSIVNYVDLLKKEPIEGERAKEYLDILDRQSQRMKKLITDLVEASKASTGNLQAVLEPVKLDLMLAQLAGEYQERLAASGLELVCETAPALTVTADARLLWRVFDNLFNNAAKYALPGTRVYLNTRIEGERAKVTMKNVSRERLDVAGEELTERFVRGDASRNSQTEGSGLGLSIAKSLAELQGGDFHVAVDGDLFKAELTLPTVAPTE